MKLKSIVLVLIIFSTSLLFSQEEVLPIVRNTIVSTGINLQIWRIAKSATPISQISFPISIVIPVKPDVNIIVTHTPSYSWWYTESKLSGLSDTWIQGSYVFFDDKAMIDLGVGVPTGKVRLSNTEYELSRHLSKRIYQYKVPVTGQGFCAKAGFAAAYDISDKLVLGMGASYIKKTAYHPVTYTYSYQIAVDSTVVTNWNGEYKPGDELILNLGLDFRIAEEMKIMFDGLYTHYGKDERDGNVVFGAGNRFDFNLGFFWRINDSRYLWTHFIFRQSGKNELLQGLYFKKEEKNTNGPQSELDINYKAIPFKEGGVFLTAEGRVYGKNEHSGGGSHVFGGGLGIQYDISQSTSFQSHIKYLIGAFKEVTTGTNKIESISMEGFELGLGFSIMF